MRLSWNEIRRRAAKFAADWVGEGYEKGQTQLFYRDFFEVFGAPVRMLASFEEPVKDLGDRRGYIDLFWKGTLLVEQKSVGRDLTKAKEQAFSYFPGLKQSELPRYLLLSDFQTFELYDLEDGDELSFALSEFPRHVEKFGFILGVQKRSFKEQNPANITASELVGRLHDSLRAIGYTGHDLEKFLVRIVFCLFADDTGIFDSRDIFFDYIVNRTQDDGSDLGNHLSHLFQILNTPEDKRLKTLDEDLGQFPYVDGDLFAEPLSIPSFDAEMRQRLIDACEFDWSVISPAIFGSLFQFVMDSEERRTHGAHYTTEKNILKVIEPLFLSRLRAEFEQLKKRRSRRRANLQAFHKRLSEMTFFDPACGCGNFLVIAYRELRELEIELIRELRSYRASEEQQELDATDLSLLDVDQFYGIEIGEFPARIAETALWMMDHIMNNRLSMEFGQSFVRIPLEKSPHIVVANALGMDWNAVLPYTKCSYVFGNPPFRGHQYRTPEQMADMARVWGRIGQVNRLDYVTCWFRKAVEYSEHNNQIDIGFVSTNSISQGEQCGIFWPSIFEQGVEIHFAHRAFQWESEAKGAAVVHCVIVGLTRRDQRERTIFEYDHARGDAHESIVSRINGYLIDGPQRSVPARSRPQSGLLEMHKGSQPTDGARLRKPGGGYVTYSNLILDEKSRDELLSVDRNAIKWLRPYVGGDELISGKRRWCLWLKDADPSELRRSRAIQERLERVRVGRLQSSTESVRNFARFPTLFTQDRQPDEGYLAIPEVSSGDREYIPMAMLGPEIIASNKLQIIVGAPLHYFGILTSAMHMAWVRTVAGRLGSGYSYAPAIYNSFPWPEITDRRKAQIERLAQAVLDAREEFPTATLEVLYSSLDMPAKLRRAHDNLDRAIDRMYRRSGFRFERERVEHLFELYEKTVVPLTAGGPRGRV